MENMVHTAEVVRQLLHAHADPVSVNSKQRYFKTGKGEYAEGDVFVGVSVPLTRAVAKRSLGLPLEEVEKLLSSKIHEERLLALIILGHLYQRAKKDEGLQERIYQLYLANTAFINNWDLVDVSAPGIVGAHLLNKEREILEKLARSDLLWERRIAIIATFFFIKKDDFVWSVRIAEMLLGDKHDLIHKATGWMLREMGERDEKALESFLEKHAHIMPRTMLRYALEKLGEEKRQRYMKKK